jgi:hypothetical protein
MAANWSQPSRGGLTPGNGIQRVESFQSDRPPGARTIAPTAYENSRGPSTSFFNSNRAGMNSSFANPRFSNANRNSGSFSGFGSSRASSFAGSIGNWSGNSFGSNRFMNSHSGGFERAGIRNRGFAGGHNNEGYGGARSTHASFGYNRGGERNGYGRHGYGRGGHRGGWYGGGSRGGGWYGGGDGLWLLDDLFGLALNFGAFALTPWSPVASLGWNLLDTGVQSLSNLNNDSQDYGYQAQSYSDDQPSYPGLCGNYYSDENPGCLQ